MEERWYRFGYQFSYVAMLMAVKGIQECLSLNSEEFYALEFRSSVDSNLQEAFANWNPNESGQCMCPGVHSEDEKMQMLFGKDFRGEKCCHLRPSECKFLLLAMESFHLHYFPNFHSTNGSYFLSASSVELLIVKRVRRRLLELSMNLPAEVTNYPGPSEPVTLVSLSTGSFPALFNHSPQPSIWSSIHPNPGDAPSQTPAHLPSADGFKRILVLVLSIVAIFIILLVVVLCVWKHQREKVTRHCAIGMDNELQKSFITGVPKMNRTELETVCDCFSKVLDNLPGCTVYKGTLSTGIDIVVISSTVPSYQNWSKCAESAFRKKIETLSRINHKNFMNILGYCEEDDPFMRMMVFESAPNGTLYQHLHVEEAESLNWNTRMRIIMGMAYCLQYMHHVLDPPVAHPNLKSHSVLLTDDYSAKIAEINFWEDIADKSNIIYEDQSTDSKMLSSPDTEANVYCFGIMLLEIISGKIPYNEEGTLMNWATEYLDEKRKISYMIDPKLKSFDNNELDGICQVIQTCIDPEIPHRPTMRQITSILKGVIAITPDEASPTLSPSWWKELEILCVEGG